MRGRPRSTATIEHNITTATTRPEAVFQDKEYCDQQPTRHG